MDRRRFLLTSLTGALAAPLAAAAQQTGRVYRIGFLTLAGPLSGPQREAFREVLRERGWGEGQNLVIEQREAKGQPERLPALAADLVSLRVDVIVTPGNTTTAAARKVTSSVPIVFVVADAVGSGFVGSLARPGGNLTGFEILSSDLAVKRLELLRGTLPRASRVAVLHTGGATHQVFLKELEPAAHALSIELRRVEVRTADDIDRAAEIIARERMNALFPLSSPFFATERRRLVDLAAKVRLPAFYEHRDYVDVGGFISYGPNFAEIFRRAAAYVDKILKGAKPVDLPVEQPTKFELIINLKTAKALGLTIPPSLLARADQILE
jgi:putative tryptophan/tyrosine transport system substrate-binding protein